MSIFLWCFDSPVISAWSPRNPRNVDLIIKTGTWPKEAHSLDWHRGLAGRPPVLELPLPRWVEALAEIGAPSQSWDVSTSLLPAARP